MPQKPQARAKDKRRLARRLATWRKKQETANASAAPAAAAPAASGAASGAAVKKA